MRFLIGYRKWLAAAFVCLVPLAISALADEEASEEEIPLMVIETASEEENPVPGDDFDPVMDADSLTPASGTDATVTPTPKPASPTDIEPVPTVAPTELPVLRPGDLNGDNALDRFDRAFLARFLSDHPSFPKTRAIGPDLADLDGDGVVNRLDRICLARLQFDIL